MKNKLNKSFIISIICFFICIPIVLYFTIKRLGEGDYILPSFVILILSFIPFLFIFEKKKVRTREIILIASLSAIAVLGRVLFFFAPEIKATGAIIIISGICLGSEAGFFIGVVSAFVSNFFFGQGTWTMWQMFAFGMVGFISGIIFKNRKKPSRLKVCIIGFILILVIYGGIVNIHSLVLFTNNLSWDSIKTIYLLSLPFDIMHAVSTSAFLFFLKKPFLEKIGRIKEKYGMIDLT